MCASESAWCACMGTAVSAWVHLCRCGVRVRVCVCGWASAYFNVLWALFYNQLQEESQGKPTGGAIHWLGKAIAQKYPAAYVRMARMHQQVDKQRIAAGTNRIAKCSNTGAKSKKACLTAAKLYAAGIAMYVTKSNSPSTSLFLLPRGP